MCVIYLFVCDIYIVYVLCKYYIFFQVSSYLALFISLIFAPSDFIPKMKYHLEAYMSPAALIIRAIKQCLISCVVLRIIYTPML